MKKILTLIMILSVALLMTLSTGAFANEREGDAPQLAAIAGGMGGAPQVVADATAVAPAPTQGTAATAAPVEKPPAETVTPGAVPAPTNEPEKLSLTFPGNVAATVIWFPEDNAVAPGIRYRGAQFNNFLYWFPLKIVQNASPDIALTLDGIVAQEVNQDKDTLAGPGMGLEYNRTHTNKAGISFIPNVGVTALNNWAKYRGLSEILQNYKWGVYGTLVQYSW